MFYEVWSGCPWTVRCPLSVQRLRESYESGPSWLLSTRLPTYHTIPSWLRWPGGYLCGVQKQSSKSHRTCSGDLCLFGLGAKSAKTNYDCHDATWVIIIRTTMTHQKSSAISGEPTFQPTPCLYGNCACVWFGTNHHLDAKNCFDFYRWGQLESRWYYMIAMISGLRLIAIYCFELDQNLAWKKRKNIPGNLLSKRATNHELMIAGWIDIQDKKKAAGCAGSRSTRGVEGQSQQRFGWVGSNGLFDSFWDIGSGSSKRAISHYRCFATRPTNFTA